MEDIINVNGWDLFRGNIDLLYMQAVRNGSIEQIDWCISQGADKHYAEDMALDTAIDFDAFSVLCYLVKNMGLDPKNNRLCLLKACKKNNLQMIEFLVEECSVDIGVSENRPVANAVLADSLEAFLYLKEKGVQLDDIADGGQDYISPGVFSPAYPVHKLADIAYQFSSIDCMRHILERDKAKELFFSDINIATLFTPEKLIAKIKDKEEVIVCYSLEKLKEHQPEKFYQVMKQEYSAQDSKKDSHQWKLWSQWLMLDLSMDKKDIAHHRQKRKI